MKRQEVMTSMSRSPSSEASKNLQYSEVTEADIGFMVQRGVVSFDQAEEASRLLEKAKSLKVKGQLPNLCMRLSGGASAVEFFSPGVPEESEQAKTLRKLAGAMQAVAENQQRKR